MTQRHFVYRCRICQRTFLHSNECITHFLDSHDRDKERIVMEQFDRAEVKFE